MHILDTFFRYIELSKSLPEELRPVLIFTALEILFSRIIEFSDERRLKKMICRITPKRRILSGLSILRKYGFLDHEQYEEIRRVIRVLRCHRNAVVHPVCRSMCRPIDWNEVEKAIEILVDAAKRFLTSRSR